MADDAFNAGPVLDNAIEDVLPVAIGEALVGAGVATLAGVAPAKEESQGQFSTVATGFDGAGDGLFEAVDWEVVVLGDWEVVLEPVEEVLVELGCVWPVWVSEPSVPACPVVPAASDAAAIHAS